MIKNIKSMHHQELFLYGYFIGYSLGLLISISLSLFVLQDYISILATIPSLGFVIYLYLHYNKHKLYRFAALGLLLNSTFVVFFHVLHNKYSLDIAFLLIIPMAAAIILSKKDLFLYGTLYYVGIIVLFIYGYFYYPHHLFLHNAQLMSSFVVLNFFVFAFGATYHFAITQSYERLEESNKQKAFLLKEIHHRVKNNLNIVASILGLEKFESNIEEVHKLINQNKLRIESIAMVHEILYQSDDLENIDFKTYITKLIEHIMATEVKEMTIDLHIDIVELKLNIEAMIQFGIIINEMLTNSIKYAFPKKKGHISIILQKHEHYYKLIYKDDGIGLKSTVSGFGQNLITISIQQLDAKLTTINKNGLRYEIVFQKEVS